MQKVLLTNENLKEKLSFLFNPKFGVVAKIHYYAVLQPPPAPRMVASRGLFVSDRQALPPKAERQKDRNRCK